MVKRLLVCLLLATAMVWGLALRSGRVRRELAPHLHLLASPAPSQRNTELSPIRKYHEVVRPHRLDAWSIIGPGGGGTFYNASISPFDPNLVFATSDMTQCYVSEDGGLTWREFNLRMTCRSFTFDPKRPGTVYALAGGAGLWRSDDRGHTWNLVFPDPSAAPVLAYMDDEAEAYIHSAHGYEALTAFAIDPEDSNTLYCTTGGDLRMSTDAGRHWKTLVSKTITATRLFVDPHSPAGNRTVILTAGSATAVWEDGKYSGPLPVPDSSWVYGFAFGAGKSGRAVLYAANGFVVKNNVLQGGGLLASEDGGRHWRSLNEGFLKIQAKDTYSEFTTIATSLHHPEVLYASIYNWHVPGDPNPYFGVVKTSDGGATWSVVTKESGAMAANMHDSWIGYHFGPDWGDQPLSFGVDANNPDLVYRTDLGRIMRSKDGGRNWEAVYSQGTENGYTTTGLDVTTCYGLHFDPFDPKRMFISYTDIGLFRSEDGGQSWVSSAAGAPAAWLNTTYWVEFDPAVKGKMWAVMSNTHDMPRMRMLNRWNGRGGVVVSSDGGRTWAASNQGLPEMVATHILLDPKSPPEARVLYVVGMGRGVFKSTDGGKTWAPKDRGLPEKNPLTWRLSLDRNGTLYVVTIRRSEDGRVGTELDGAVYRSRDGAESWERMALPENVNGPVSVTIDPQDAERMYLSVWGRYARYAGKNPPDGGVYLSTDGGRKWANVLNGSRRIYDVTVDSRNPNLVYACGFDSSAWRSADRGKTWTRIRGYNFKDGHRVIPDPADASKIYITTFGSSVWHGPAAGDPKAVEDIVSPAPVTFAAPLQ